MIGRFLCWIGRHKWEVNNSIDFGDQKPTVGQLVTWRRCARPRCVKHHWKMTEGVKATISFGPREATDAQENR